MADTTHILPATRPELTFPEAEAAWVRDHYTAANVILEYGSGGSTAMAADMPGKTVFAVENARPWLRQMRKWFDENPPKATVHLHDAFIGPTKKWGFPEGTKKLGRWPHYPLSVWDREGFQQPDVVLIDGRFRVGCFLATLFRTKKPVSVLFDDYVDRKPYRVVEEFAEPAEIRGRMVRFEIQPKTFDVADMARIFELMLRTQ